MDREINKLDMNGTKWDIFVASIDLFAEKSFDKVSVRDIAKAVGVKPASLYNHFDSKDDILDEVFRFWIANNQGNYPNKEEIFSYIGKKKPEEILMMTNFHYSSELQPIMEKIIIIASNEMRNNKVAEKLVKDYIIGSSKDYMREVLEKMIEEDVIEPLNVEGFLNLHANYAFGASLRTYSDLSVNREEWSKSLKVLFSLVKEKPPSPVENR